MKTKFLALVAASAVTLMGCSLDQLNFLPAARISAVIPDITFKAELDPATGALGTINETQIVAFRAASGSMGARVKGYEAVYEDQAGQVVAAITPKRQTVNAQVEPGRVCDDKTGNCVFAVGPESKASIDFLTQQASGVIAREWVRTGTIPNWRARITFFGVNSNGVDFQWEELQSITCTCTLKKD
jgi:hypothetical protein